MVIFFFSWQFILSTSSSSMNFLSLLILVFFYCSTFQRLCLSTWGLGKFEENHHRHTQFCVYFVIVCFQQYLASFFGSSHLERNACGQIIQRKVCFLCAFFVESFGNYQPFKYYQAKCVNTTQYAIRWKCDFYSEVCVSFVYSWLFFLWQCLVISVCFFQELFCWKIFTSCFKCWIYLHFHLFKFLEHYKLTPTSFHSAWNRSI